MYHLSGYPGLGDFLPAPGTPDNSFTPDPNACPGINVPGTGLVTTESAQAFYDCWASLPNFGGESINVDAINASLIAQGYAPIKAPTTQDYLTYLRTSGLQLNADGSTPGAPGVPAPMPPAPSTSGSQPSSPAISSAAPPAQSGAIVSQSSSVPASPGGSSASNAAGSTLELAGIPWWGWLVAVGGAMLAFKK